MFANFTEETCTGTGATLTLTGATTDNIAFSKTFLDGDVVFYTLRDSGGIIKIAGSGTYVSSSNSITRDDTWNWNGTIIDDNPSANIALSAGTHTITCTTTVATTYSRNRLSALSPTAATGQHYVGTSCSSITVTQAMLADTLYVFPLHAKNKCEFKNLVINISATGTATLARVGLYHSTSGGDIGKIITQAEFDASTTGGKSSAITQTVNPGDYWVALLANGTFSTLRTTAANGSHLGTMNKYNGSSFMNNSGTKAQAYASLPSDLSGNTWTSSSSGSYQCGVTL